MSGDAAKSPSIRSEETVHESPLWHPETSEILTERVRKLFDASKPDDFQLRFMDVWRGCSPLFAESESVMAIVKNFASCARLFFDDNERKIGFDTGGNMVIYGVSGVGKTTLLEGFKRTIEALDSFHQNNGSQWKVVLAFCDYSNVNSNNWKMPVDLLADRAVQCGAFTETERETVTKPHCDPLQLLGMLVDRGHRVIFLADEVQMLYRKSADEGDKTCTTVRQIRMIGKKPGCFAAVCGSTTSLRQMIFRSGGDSDGYKQYADLNHTVFEGYRLAPVRSKNQLEAAVKLFKPGLLKACDIDDIFAATGGVGRFVRTHDVSRRPVHTETFLAEVASDPTFRKIVNILFDLNDTATGYNLWEPQSLSVPQIMKFVDEKQQKHLTHKLFKWVDSSLLFQKESYESVEFFSKGHFDALSRYLHEPAAPRRLLVWAVDVTLNGWGKHANDGGTVLEQHILQRYAEHNGYNYENRKLTFTDTVGSRQFCIGRASSDTLKCLKDFHKLAFDVAADKGLDGFLVDVDYNKKGGVARINISVVQVKTGRRNKKITRGSAMAARNRTNTTVVGILAKALHGMKEFTTSFKRHLKTLKIKMPKLAFVDITLLTTKQLNADARELVGKNIRKTKIEFRCENAMDYIDGALVD